MKTGKRENKMTRGKRSWGGTMSAPGLLIFLLLAPLLAACGGSASEEVTLEFAPLSDLPAEIRQSPPEVRDAYRFALANRETLDVIPCYCGCGGGSHQHRNNTDCYIDEVRPDGTVAFDNHAFR